VDRNLRLARAIGLRVDPPEFPLGLAQAEFASAADRLSRAAGRSLPSFIAVIPGARWNSKRWPAQRLADLVDRLEREGFPPCLLLGGPDDRQLATQIGAACKAPVLDLVGQTSLRELAAFIKLADLVICHDSGPMHMAAALDKPLVAIFGPTSPDRTGPYGKSAGVVRLPLPCSPCYQRDCPLGHHQCLRELSVDLVLRKVREVWPARPQSPLEPGSRLPAGQVGDRPRI